MYSASGKVYKQRIQTFTGRSVSWDAPRLADCLVNGMLAVKGFARLRNFSCSTCCFINSILVLARNWTRRLVACEATPATPTPLLHIQIHTIYITDIYIYIVCQKNVQLFIFRITYNSTNVGSSWFETSGNRSLPTAVYWVPVAWLSDNIVQLWSFPPIQCVQAAMSAQEGLVILDEASYCRPVWPVRTVWTVRCFYRSLNKGRS